MILNITSKLARCEYDGCNVEFHYKPGSTGRYCSSSCSAKVNNRKFPKRKSTEGLFLVGYSDSGKAIHKKSCSWESCEQMINHGAEHCKEHYVLKRRQDKIELWLSGLWSGGGEKRPDDLSSVIREYLLEKANYACEVCGFNTPHPVDGATILEIDHTDGNPENHRPENLKVLCPNHHALTPTYRARNTGNGRKSRYQ